MPPDDSPLVSLLVPVSDSTVHLDECLGSLLAQSWHRLEIVVGDFTDGPCRCGAISSLAGGDPRVRTVHSTRTRPSDRFSALLESAQGDYARFVLPEDRLRPSATEAMVALLQADRRLVMATSARVAIDAEGRPAAPPRAMAPLAPANLVIHRAAVETALTLATNVIGELSAILFRRDAVDPSVAFRLGDVSFDALADLCLCLHLLAGGFGVYLDEALCEIRLDPERSPGVGMGGIRTLAEWMEILPRARRLGYLGDLGAEATAYGHLFQAVVELALNGDNLLHDALPALTTDFALRLGALQDRITGARVAVILIPRMPLAAPLLEKICGTPEVPLQLVSVEEEERPPAFEPFASMPYLAVAPVRAGIGLADSWNAGAEVASAPLLLFVGDPDGLEIADVAVAASRLSGEPLCAASTCGDAEGISALIVRRELFRRVGGFRSGKDARGERSNELFADLADRLRRDGWQIS